MPHLIALEISEISEKEFYLPSQGVIPVNDNMRKEDVVGLVKAQKDQAKVIHSAEVGLAVIRKQLANTKKELLAAQIDKEIALEHAQDSERQRRGISPAPPHLNKGKQKEEDEEDQSRETPRPGGFPGGDDDPDDPSGNGGGGDPRGVRPMGGPPPNQGMFKLKVDMPAPYDGSKEDFDRFIRQIMTWFLF